MDRHRVASALDATTKAPVSTDIALITREFIIPQIYFPEYHRRRQRESVRDTAGTMSNTVNQP